LYATEFIETEYRIEEYNWLCAAERADSAGADIITTSLGYTDFDDPSMDYKYSDLDGETSVITQAANLAINKGMVVVTSAGNYGDDAWTYISPPADAENILAVGSVNADLSHSNFSSYGRPTADGKFKPDVMALGGPAATILPNGSVKYESGTSVSCPQVTSLVAGVMQKWPELTALQIVQLIRESGSYYFKPDTIFGYGIPSYRAVKNIMEQPSVLNNDILIYPNPVDNMLNVALSTIDGSPTRLQVYSILGQPLLEINYESIWHLNPISVDLSTYLPGQYIVRVENKNAYRTFRIIKR
jgi:subtilisin family serine protease